MKRSITILAVVAIVLLGWSFSRKNAPPSPPPPLATKLPTWAENKKGEQLAIVKTIVANIETQKDAETQFRRYLDLFRKSRQSLFAEEEREIFLSQSARNKEVVLFAKELLESAARAKELLGADQAEGRLLAIQVMRKNAEIEGPAEIEAVLSQLSKRLISESKVTPGEKRDLEDLLASYTSLRPEESYRNLDSVLQKITYHDSLRPQIVTGIYLGLKNRYSKEEIESLLSENHLLERSN